MLTLRTSSERTFPVANPATLDVIDHVPDMSVEEIADSVGRAEAAFAGWRAMPADDRADILKESARLIEQRQEDLARTITLESGKPLAESRGEARVAAKFAPPTWRRP